MLKSGYTHCGEDRVEIGYRIVENLKINTMAKAGLVIKS